MGTIKSPGMPENLFEALSSIEDNINKYISFIKLIDRYVPLNLENVYIQPYIALIFNIV